MTLHFRYAALLVALLLYGACARADIATLSSRDVQLRVDTTRGSIVGWQICYTACDTAQNPAHVQELVTTNQPVELLLTSPADARWHLLEHDESSIELISETGRTDSRGARLRMTLTNSHLLRISIEGDHLDGHDAAPVLLRLTAPDAFKRDPGEGFAGSREFIEPLAIRGHDVLSGNEITPGNADPSEHLDSLPTRDWSGFRNRFWLLLATIDSDEATWRFSPAGEKRKDFWEVTLPPDVTITVYAGPLDPPALSEADPILQSLLFKHLWFWLRWLCLGMLALLNSLATLLGSWAFAIIALSVILRVLMTPLTRVARRWQSQVNQIQSRLQPRINAIKRESSGEEQANRILAAHKELGVTPFYTFRSTLGFLIQIPVFLAAFNVLNEAAGLNGASFLWIDDLTQPDHFLRLPFDTPFFGGYLNLLPVIMTATTLLAAWQLRDETLSDELRARRRRNLYGMAALFFVLFYTFPAGMVLYWTATTLLQSLWDLLRRPRRSRPAQRDAR